MVNIQNYINDGANWQAQAVLAYLRNQETNAINSTWDNELRKYMTNIKVGRYENLREQGYIFSVAIRGKQRNYAVYEHRNSDMICVVIFDKLTLNTPSLNDVINAMGDNKWNYTKSFEWGEIVECGDYIIVDMKAFIATVEAEADAEANVNAEKQ